MFEKQILIPSAEEIIAERPVPAELKKIKAEREELSDDDEQAEFMYLGLRCMSGVSKKDFCDCFGVELAERYGGVIEKWKAGGFLAEKDGRIFLTGRGIDVSNRIFADFI